VIPQLRHDAGANIGRKIARDGRLVEGTHEAIRAEMIGLFGDLDGEMVKKMRLKLEEMSGVLKKDRGSGGSYEARVTLSRLGL